MSFQDSSMSREGSVIDYLRSSFGNDDLLKDILLEMSEDDGVYKDLNVEQKRILCTYPKGVLYRDENSSMVKIPVSDFVQSVEKEYLHRVVGQAESFKDLGDFLLDNHRFEEAVIAISLNN